MPPMMSSTARIIIAATNQPSPIIPLDAASAAVICGVLVTAGEMIVFTLGEGVYAVSVI